MKALLSIGQAAARLGLSVDTVRELERSGVLSAERTPGGHRRFRPVVLDAYLGRHSSRARRSTSETTSARKRRKRDRTLPAEETDWIEPEEEWTPPKPVPTKPLPALPHQPYDELTEQIRQATAERTERNRLDSLRTYGNSLIPWNASAGARSAVLETVASYVTTSRFPSSIAAWEAHQAIKAKVEAVLEPYERAEAREVAKKAESDREEQQIRTLIERGKSRARIKTFSWGYEDSREARAEVQEELESEVEDDWSDSDVEELVDEILEEWDEESGD